MMQGCLFFIVGHRGHTPWTAVSAFHARVSRQICGNGKGKRQEANGNDVIVVVFLLDA